uniref:Uncharacterized protein n=2 Tax=Oryza sativa subsp. japonica TaxID=39947 RepID=Q53LZ9_ORYSJ|nr:hypothetical protein LOC_Os11g16600 [Oryza sativa Japonica Group]AAX96335.1 hypothetical protein [Oryza sativa Japonica Group]ABA92592.1 hypothetical protein LOC_Os11g16600 [Oryza sativa Japonica Group]
MSTFEIATRVFRWYGDRWYQGIYEIEVKEMETGIFIYVRALYLTVSAELLKTHARMRAFVPFKNYIVCHLLLNSQSRQYEECNLKTVVLQNSDNAGSSAHESGNLSIKHLQIQNHLY